MCIFQFDLGQIRVQIKFKFKINNYDVVIYEFKKCPLDEL